MTASAVGKPHPAAAERYLRDLSGTLEADTAKGRDLLAMHLGQLRMTPKNEGPRRSYVATGTFSLNVPLGDDARQETKVAGAGFEPATFGL